MVHDQQNQDNLECIPLEDNTSDESEFDGITDIDYTPEQTQGTLNLRLNLA